MATAVHLAPRLLLALLIPLGLIFFGVFFAAVTAEQRRRHKAVRAVLGQLEDSHAEPSRKAVPHSRYSYALEQQQHERELLHFTQLRPIRFRSSHTGLSGKH